jgi:4-hydroxybenzoyl-CoA reductase beta subunit
MHLPKFEYLRPSSVGEVCRLLKKHGPRARLAAGGTDLFPRMKYGLESPEVVISLKGVPVNSPKITDNDELQLDALMTLADVALSPVVLKRALILAEAALNVGSNQIRHMGTLGGNLCLETRCTYYNQRHTFQYVEPCFKRNGHRCYLLPKGKKCQAVFMADTVPALICLDAKVKIMSTSEDRQVPLEELYSGNSLKPVKLSDDDIVTDVIIPNSASLRGTGFKKFSSRGGLEFAALTVAALLDMVDNGNTCVKARIVLGSVSARPVRALKAENALSGQKLSDKLLQDAAHEVAAEVRPVMHHGYSIPFLKECLRVQTLRALTLAANRINQKQHH